MISNLLDEILEYDIIKFINLNRRYLLNVSSIHGKLIYLQTIGVI